jgi:hypothetical protein
MPLHPDSCPNLLSQVAVTALVTATSVSSTTGAGPVHGAPSRARWPQPGYANGLGHAIFAASGLDMEGNFTLNGESGPNADIYTNGDFNCDQGNQIYQGSVYSQEGSRSSETASSPSTRTPEPASWRRQWQHVNGAS